MAEKEVLALDEATPQILAPQSGDTYLMPRDVRIQGEVTVQSGTVTASAPVLDLTQTWNNAAVTFTGLKFNATDTASGASSLLMDLQVGGTSRFKVEKTGNTVITPQTPGPREGLTLGNDFFLYSGAGFFSIGHQNNSRYRWTSTAYVSQSTSSISWADVYSNGTIDLSLFRDAANTFAQRNSTNAQTFRLYGTYTDASNYRRLASTSTTAGAFTLSAEGLGTGATGNTLEFATNGTTRLTVAADGFVTVAGESKFTQGFRLSNSGSQNLQISGSYVLFDIGSGTNGYRFRGTSFADIFFMSAGGLLQFAGTTSSFPALKRSGAGLISRLADDSADAAFTASTLTASSSAANTSAIASTGYSLTGSSAVSMVDLAGTWNTTGTPTAIKLNVTDTASNAASLLMDLGTGGGSFVSKFSVSKAGGVIASAGSATAVSYGTGQANTGIYSRSAGFLVLSANGTPRIDMSSGQIFIGSGLGFTTTANATTGSVAYFGAEAANVLAQSNGNNTQTFRLYGRYTDATNDFERFFITASGTAGAAVQLGTQKGATAGTARALELQTDGTTRLTITSAGTAQFAGQVQLPATNYLAFTGRSLIGSDADGNIRLTNNATTDFNRLQFGGTTSSFPALKRNSAALNVRLADDSGDANLTAAALTLSGNLTISTKDIVTDTTTGTKIGTGTTQKLGFFDATPVVQQNGTGETTGFTAGSGTAVNDDSTFTGNVGATAYRINDIVKALKNLGLLAQ